MFNQRHNLTKHACLTGQLRIAAIVLTLLSLMSIDCFATIIKLREERCTPSGNVVTLGDVANILDPDLNRVRGLQQIILAPAPAPGAELLFDHQQIKTRLHAVGINLLEIEFAGRSQVWVTGGETVRQGAPQAPGPISINQQQKAQQRVEEAISRSLSHRYPHAGRFQVSARMSQEQLSTLLQTNPEQIMATGGTPPFQQEQNYLIQFMTKEGKALVLQVPCTTQIVPRVLAVMQPISRGQVIKIEHLGWRNPTDLELKRLPSTQPEQVVGREATRDLQTADAITEDNVRTVPLVSSGEMITVYSRKGGVSVRIDVKAMGTAGLGESVVVYGPDGKTKISARVTGYHEAEITDESPDRVPSLGSLPVIGTYHNQVSSTGGYAR